MEKVFSTNKGKLKRILVTGPESSGKTDLANYLADRFDGELVQEYARSYVEGLERPYTFEDVEHIAWHQLSSFESQSYGKEWVFFDTWLIITKVWFEVVYKAVPKWIDRAIAGAGFDLVLLCAPDLPWIPDGVRENGGLERDRLFDYYKKELGRYGMEWEEVSGNGEERYALAEEIIYRKTGYGTI